MSDQASKASLPEGSKIFCPACNAKLDVSGLVIHSKFFCPGCNAKIQVPEENLTLQSKPVAEPKNQKTETSSVSTSDIDRLKNLAKKAILTDINLPGSKSTNKPPEKVDSSSNTKEKDETTDAMEKVATAKQTALDETMKDQVEVTNATTIQDKTPETVQVPVVETTAKKEPAPAPKEEHIDPNGLNKVKCHSCGKLNDFSKEKAFDKIPCSHCSEKIIVPKRFQHFLLEDELSDNQFAKVYRALDLSLNREVCIKIFNKDISANEVLVKALIEKLSLSATLTQQNIVPIYTSGTFEEQFFMVSQYMNQQSLEAFITKAKGELPINACLKTLHEVSKGLLEYSRHKQYHHHLSPRNILINSDGQIKVTDFNIFYTIMLDQKDKSLYGTDFVSPELIHKGKDTDSTVDVFHLGLIAQQLITGKIPYEASNQEDLMDLHLEKTPEKLSDLRSDTPQELCDFVQKMLSVRPSDRPSLSETEKELDKLRNPQKANLAATRMKTPVSKPPLEKDEDKFKHAKLQDTDLAHEDLLIQLNDKEKKSPIAIIAIILVLICVIGFFLSQNNSSEDKASEVDAKPVEVPKDPQDIAVALPDDPMPNDIIPEDMTSDTKTVEPSIEVVEIPTPTPIIEEPVTVPLAVDVPIEETETPNQFEEEFTDFAPVMANKEKRPFPNNLDFSPTISEFIDYLNSQPDSQRKAIEHERLRLLNRIRFYLIKVLSNTPYEGKVFSREFEDSIDGFLEVKNDQLLMGRKGADFTLEVDVTQLEDIQFAKVLEFFAKSKLDQVLDSPEAIAKELKESAAEDYFKAALLMDWFKNEKMAQAYLNLATQLNPNLTNHYKVFFDGQE
ncbi:serine/threonine-protein kinase [Lentisphaera profundi]|uniref:mitogen-activated protein kinase kinase n=1 Tax=Lentisphaera profundi TaxID=1658616 RepID=A0ABY7VVK2_9BACT|nr:serine/threonine-protein kinase [Lentisphaera profundi]WDE98253.1 serine/threonine-protein kinase [Lentisphaera profundi]